MRSSMTMLGGLRMLVVEDEAMVAMMVEDMLVDLGCLVVDVAGSLPKALTILERPNVMHDGAVLDVNLGGEKVFAVAEALIRRNVPFVFATGYGVAGLEGRFPGVPVLAKPFEAEALGRALVVALQREDAERVVVQS